jgi:predicted ABC-type exoprotein transport system permease subunit
MAAPTFSELARAILHTLLTAWRPCQPLLAAAALAALALSATAGLLLGPDVAEGVATLPMLALTLAVSAGVAGFIVSGDGVYTRLDTVVRQPRAYAFVARYVLLSLGLSLPLLAVMPVFVGGGEVAGGSALVLVAVLAVTLWLSARLAVFPYSAFLGHPLTIAEAFRRTQGQALKILGCLALFASAILLVVTLVTLALAGLVTGLGDATGLGGGGATRLGLQSLGQLVAAYAVDCVYGTITRALVTGAPPPAALEE